MKLEIFLLRLYPREWRARYEDEFTALLEQNPSSLLDIADVALGALDAHLRPQVTATAVGVGVERRPFMSRMTFIQWSGMAAMIGTVLLFLGLGGWAIYSDSDYRYTYSVENLAAKALTLAAAVLILIGTIGFGLAYARRTGGLGQGGLLITLLASSTLVLGSVVSVMEKVSNDLPNWAPMNVLYVLGSMVPVGVLIMYLGMALFAMAGLQRRVLPVPAALLVLVGGISGVTLALLWFTLVRPFSGGGATMSTDWWLVGTNFLAIVVYLSGFFLLGCALWSGRGAAVRPAERTSAG